MAVALDLAKMKAGIILRSVIEKVFYIASNRLLKTLLIRLLKEVKNMLLQTGEGEILVT